VSAAAVLHPHLSSDNPWPARVARIGILSRGVIHLLVGWLAWSLARGDLGERADQRGALGAVVRQPMGRVLVLVLAVGFLCYAAWRALEAWLDTEDKGAVQRAGQAARAVLYVALAWSAVRLASGGSQQGSGSRDVATGVFGWPGGRWIVLAAGLAVVGTGLWNGYRAVSRSFAKRLKDAEMSATERTWTVRAGVFGHAARMVAYLVVGWFLVRAALRFDPAQPVGLDESLHALAGASYGPWLLGLVGLGLVAFGLYQVMLARYREVLDS
jgi:hypothetical protein